MNPMLESFISESRDNLEEASQCFLALEQAPDDASIMQNLFRAMHTIKGSSGLFDLGPFTRLMHVAEDILDLARGGLLQLSSDHIDVLLNAMDQITDWIDELEQSGELSSNAENCAAPHIAALSSMIPAELSKSQNEPHNIVLEKDCQTSFSEVKNILTMFSDHERLLAFAKNDQVTVISYRPQAECFFTGDDPLHTARLTPQLLAISITSNETWPTIEQLDPYQCNLRFQVLSGAGFETLMDHYRYVEDDIEVHELELPWLVFPCGEWTQDTSLFDDILMPLSQHIENESWHDIPSLLNPVIELANPDTFQASCLRWISAVADQAASEKHLMLALYTALNSGQFDITHTTQASNSDHEDTSESLLQVDTADLEDEQHLLLATQIQMLELAQPQDVVGRIMSVELILRRLLSDSLMTSQLDSAVTLSVNEKSPTPLIEMIRALLESSTEITPLACEQNDDEDNIDMASLVRQEQASRVSSNVSASEAIQLDTPSSISTAQTEAPINHTLNTTAIDGTGLNKAENEEKPTNKDGLHPHKAQVLKVDQQRIDMLMDLVGELVVAKNSLPYLAKKAEEEYQVRALAKEIKSQYAVINRLAESMQSTMMQIRMVPVSTIFQRFPRLVRDLSRKLNKDVRLVLEGEESEADKNVVENLADPLIHLVRNSLDHGFETEQERVEQGKPAQGTLYLRAIPKDDQVIIEVVDDGRGMDPNKLKQSAYRKGIINEQKLETITDQEALYLIFAPGFSTAEQVSDLSGRGVGMDVVNGLVQQAGGKVTIESELGKGTTIRLYLPLTMAVSRVMMVEVQDQCFGISMENIVETVKVPHDRLLTIKQGQAIVLRDKVIPVLSLHSLLALPETEYEEEVPLLIMSLSGEDIALKIDLFHEGIDIVQKPLAGLMAQYNYYSGSALLGDGRVLLILNIKELLSCQ